MTGSVLGKKKTIKLDFFPDAAQFTLSRQVKTANITDLGVPNTHTQLFNKNLRV